jgi:hypothetical protein
MPMHKLKDGPITLTVADISPVEGNFGAQYKITSDEGVDVYVNIAPFDRQLGRLSLDVESIVGQTIHMEQVQKNGTTFTNVSLARPGAPTGVQAPRQAPNAAAPAAAYAPAPKLSVTEAAALYTEALMRVAPSLNEACGEYGIPLTADALHSAAATVVIAATKR